MPNSYADGTITIAAGEGTLVGAGTAWSTQVKPGDLITTRISTGGSPENFRRAIVGFVESVTDDTHIELQDDYEDEDLAAATYRSVRGYGWWSGAEQNETLIAFLTELGPLGLAGTSNGAPSASTGRNNEIRFDRINRILYQKYAGSWLPIASTFNFDAFGDVTTSPSERDQYDTEAAGFTFFSLTESGFYVLLEPEGVSTPASWSELVIFRGATVEEVLAELGVHNITISTDPPSGGENNDLWFQVGA